MADTYNPGVTFAAGARLGRYEIVGSLGAGGMGEVYRARDAHLGRDVAIKVLPSAFAHEPDRRARFEQEARAIAALSHPNILTIHDVGREGDVEFLVTELLEGQTLRERLESGSVPVHQAIEFMMQIAGGLAAAHDRGIVHRDLKPENVFVTTDAVVKILDFGLARMAPPIGSAASEMTRADTSPGTVLGTVGYMAPEQVRGQTADARADIFALGAIFYEAVTGHRAFAGPSPADTLSAILTSHPPAVATRARAVPSGIDRLVQRCLEKQPAERFQSARDLRFALESMKAGLSAPRTVDVTTATPSIAVLPFTDMSPAQDQAYFCEGMAEEVINALTRIDGMRVAARTSTFQFKARGHDVKQIAQALDVTTVLEGSVRTAGRRLRVTAQLVDAETGRAIWSDRYDGEMADVFDIQDRISASIVAALKVRLLGTLTPAAPDRGTANLEAYQQYLRGRHHRFSTYNLKEALAAFEEAVRLDPDYAQAHVGLAFTLMVLGNWGYLPPQVSYAGSHAALARALAIAPRHPAVLALQAYLMISFERRFDEGWRLFEQAIALNPSDPDPHAYRAILRGAVAGDAAGVRADVNRLMELDPYSEWALVASSFAWAGVEDYRKARDLATRGLEIRPDSLLGHFVAAIAASLLGDHAEAIRVIERGVELSRQAIWMTATMGAVYGRAGRIADAETVLQSLDARGAHQYLNPIWRAVVAIGLGRIEEALDNIESLEGTVNASLTFIRLRPWSDLRTHPRFRALMARVGLPPFP